MPATLAAVASAYGNGFPVYVIGPTQALANLATRLHFQVQAHAEEVGGAAVSVVRGIAHVLVIGG
jgi:hypothetical protein